MRVRGLVLPPTFIPRYLLLARIVLKFGKSAPGVDGRAYEVYQFGVHFVTLLLGQAYHCAECDDFTLDNVLWEAIDLLVWIDKKSDTLTADGKRPLELPPVFRRLFFLPPV